MTTADRIALTGGADAWHLHPLGDLPGIAVADGPHGLRKQDAATATGINDSDPATCFPPAVALASTWSRQMVGSVGEALGVEARSQGVSILLGPGVNIKRSPLCGRNFEYFSEDPLLTGELGAAFVCGVQGRGVGTSLKHFACNNQETNRLWVSADVDERPLREIYLRGFEIIVRRAQPWTIMCSYNQLNGTPVNENHWLLTEVLRDEWGFEGFVMSDWGAVTNRVRALEAGLDLQMPDDAGRGDELVAGALASGELNPAVLDRAVARIARVVTRAAETLDKSSVAADDDAHHALAREAAERAIVLLTNDGVLPLSSDANVTIVGEFARTPRYQGAGSSHVNPTRLDTALDALRELLDHEPKFAPGFSITDEPTPVGAHGEAVDASRDADVVVCFLGLGEHDESEGFDRETLDLPPDQLALLDDICAVNDNVVVVLSNGAAVTVPFAGRVRAVVEGWLLGQAGGPAIADVLLGVVNPSGKLAETIPHRLQDVPSYLHFPGDEGHVRYGEGLFVGYRGYDAVGADVAFPFGHGLSYTTFAFSDATAASCGNDVHLELSVTNTGERAGREVVQAYVSVPNSTRPRPRRELKGFAEVTLEPGESQRMVIDIDAADLACWSPKHGRWVVEGGDYVIELGSSSRDLRQRVELTLAGDEPPALFTRDSTLAELLGDGRAAGPVRDLLSSFSEIDDPSPEARRMFGAIPIGRLVDMGEPIDEDELHEVLRRVNEERR